MAEPLSIAAACFALAKSIVSTVEFISEVHNASKEVRSLREELRCTQQPLDELHKLLSENRHNAFIKSSADHITTTICNCQETVSKIDFIVRKHLGRKWKWVLVDKSKAEQLRSSLQSHRGDLNIALHALSLSVNVSMSQNVETLLEEFAKLKGTLASQGGNVMLQRLLEDARSYAQRELDPFEIPFNRVDQNSGFGDLGEDADEYYLGSKFVGSPKLVHPGRRINGYNGLFTPRTADVVVAVDYGDEYMMACWAMSPDRTATFFQHWPTYNVFKEERTFELEKPAYKIKGLIPAIGDGVYYIHVPAEEKSIWKEVFKRLPRPAHLGPKTLTKIAYTAKTSDTKGGGGGILDYVMWGNEVTTLMKSYNCGKGLLADNDTVNKIPLGMTVVQVASDYLSRVRHHILKELRNILGRDLLFSASIDYLFTIPPLWSAQAKDALESAVRSAGFRYSFQESIYLIPESEAVACLYLNDTEPGNTLHKVKNEDCVIVCNCRPWAVEVESYSITSAEQSTRLKSIPAPDGAPLSAPHREFMAWMKRNFGTNFESLPEEEIGVSSTFMTTFNQIIYNETPLDITVIIDLSMPKAPESDMYKEGQVIITGKILRSFFMPSMSRIYDVLVKQLRRLNEYVPVDMRKIIILSGELAPCPLIRETLSQWVAWDKNTEIVSTFDSYYAVTKGAILKYYSCTGTLPDTRSPRHFGIGGIKNASHGTTNLDDDFMWLIEKGERIWDDSYVTVPLRSTFAWGTSYKVSFVVYSSDSIPKPASAVDPSVKIVGPVDFEFKDIRADQFQVMVMNGQAYLHVEHTLNFYPYRRTEEGGVAWNSILFEATCKGRKLDYVKTLDFT